MENQFLIDSEYLSKEALEKKHRLETDPSSRKNHMEYMEGMEQIKSDVMDKVMSQMHSYDYEKYTAKDVKAALEHETCSIEDFKALLSPAAEPFLEQMAQKAKIETSKTFWKYGISFYPSLYSKSIAKTIAFIVVLTVIIILTACSLIWSRLLMR